MLKVFNSNSEEFGAFRLAQQAIFWDVYGTNRVCTHYQHRIVETDRAAAGDVQG